MAAAQQAGGNGPIAGPAVTVDAEGVRIPGFVQPQSPDPAYRWQPTWIASDVKLTPTVAAVRFRRVVMLNGPVTQALALVTADPHYQLWINGVLVSRGPDDAGGDFRPHDRWSHRWLANRVDVTPYLHTGENILAAEVYPGNFGSFSLKAGTFAMRLSFLDQAGGQQEIATGRDWSAQVSAAYTRAKSDMAYDARLEDVHWRDAVASTAGWTAAQLVDSVWGPVAISELPAMMEAVYPYSRIEGLRVEYDRVLTAYVAVALEGPAGTVVTVGTSETRTGRVRNPFQVTLGEGVTLFEAPMLRDFAFIQMTVANASAPVKLRAVQATFVSQPVAYRGSFTSSDDHLNALWKAARWQTQLCMQNHWLDSPDHQEPISDAGDYLIESQVSDYAFGAVPLTHQFLRQWAAIEDNWMASHPAGAINFHTSYSLLWLQTLLDDYDATGDPALARELAPSAYRVLARYAQWIGNNGLLSEAPNYLFMDWVKIAGFNAHHPPAVIGQGYLTAFYYRGLQDGLRLAQLTGDTGRAAALTTQMAALRTAFNRELWDADAGLYRDGRPFQNHQPTTDPNLLPPDTDIVTHSPQVNALAVLYDVAPVERQRAVMQKMLAGPGAPDARAGTPLASLNVQPYFMHFIFAAEAHAGLFGAYAAAQLAQWTLNHETGTFQEMWNSGDWSHGWGGTPLVQMSAQILGVTAASPGFGRVRLAPQPLALRFARGVVPTPHGDIHVAWTRDARQFQYQVDLPSETSAEADFNGVAGAEHGVLTIDGRPMADTELRAALSAGTHTLVLRWK